MKYIIIFLMLIVCGCEASFAPDKKAKREYTVTFTDGSAVIAGTVWQYDDYVKVVDKNGGSTSYPWRSISKIDERWVY